MSLSSNSHPRILIHCQYVYGIGHLVRTLELARGLSTRFQVFILNGGQPVPGFDIPEAINLIQLPAIYKKENTKHLIPVDNTVDLEECFLKREEIIKQTVQYVKPHILITEHFPFGLLFEVEVVALINEVKKVNPEAKIVCSVRDLIESEDGGKKDNNVCELVNALYDLVLVHGDEKLATLSKSFPSISKIDVPIIHTGYIVRSAPAENKIEVPSIILASVAAGRLGSELLDALIDSHLKIKSKCSHKLVLFSGAFEKDFAKLQNRILSLQSNDISLHLFDSRNYLNWLSKASLVISLGGYNSILEAICAKKPMLIYRRQFSEGNQEQSLRIEIFERIGYLNIISSDDLTAGRLAEIVLNKVAKVEITKHEINMNGVENSIHTLVKLVEK